MRTRSFRRTATIVAAWAVILGCLPTGGAIAGPIASTNGKVTTVRDEDVIRIESILANPRMARALARRGITPDDLREKMEKMSDHEVHMLAERLETTKSGQGVAGVLILILLVVLIVYLVKNA